VRLVGAVDGRVVRFGALQHFVNGHAGAEAGMQVDDAG
jgi:hypothetical protein